MYRAYDDDIEKVAVGTKVTDFTNPRPVPETINEPITIPGDTFEYYDNSLPSKARRFLGKLHVEQRGIERVPEDERNDTSYANIGSMVRLLNLPHTFFLFLPLLRWSCLTNFFFYIVDGCKYGGQFFCYRCPGKINF